MKFNSLGARILLVVISLLILSVSGIGFYSINAGPGHRTVVSEYEISWPEDGPSWRLTSTASRGRFMPFGAGDHPFYPQMLNAEVGDVVIRQFGAQNGSSSTTSAFSPAISEACL